MPTTPLKPITGPAPAHTQSAAGTAPVGFGSLVAIKKINMCYCVYIGTSEAQIQGQFVPNETDIYFEKPTEEDLKQLQDKFTKPYIYYVGSDTNCSCGLDFQSDQYDNPEWADRKSSPKRFLDFIKERVQKEELEFYCCWSGDIDSQPEDYLELNANTIYLEKNYFGLTERQFRRFIKNSNQHPANAVELS